MIYGNININTQRLLVRSYKLVDASALFNMVSANKTYLSDSMPVTLERNTTIEESTKHIEQTRINAESGSAFVCGIFITESEKLIGQIAIFNIDWRVPKCELSYFIAEANIGQHYGSEALQAVTDYCLLTLRMIKVYLRIAATNYSSKRIAQKCGYTKQGIMHNEFKTAGGQILHLEYWERINSI